MKIITISREFGSGGRELGKRLAESLGFYYYDREIITEIAKETELDEGYVSKVFEKGVSTFTLHFGTSFSGLSVINQTPIDILIAQQKIIKTLAKKGNCVIVGRSANAILNEYHPFNIFAYADMDYKIDRCQSIGSGTENFSRKEILKHIKQIDNGRAKTHELFSPIKWGQKEGYNLCVNTTNVVIKDIIPAVSALADAWFCGNKN